eukprot:scaffold23224_cov33-Phaeocystis_antarctica.AAC.1
MSSKHRHRVAYLPRLTNQIQRLPRVRVGVSSGACRIAGSGAAAHQGVDVVSMGPPCNPIQPRLYSSGIRNCACCIEGSTRCIRCAPTRECSTPLKACRSAWSPACSVAQEGARWREQETI